MPSLQRAVALRFAVIVLLVFGGYLLYSEDEITCPPPAARSGANADAVEFEFSLDPADRLAVFVPYITKQVPQILSNFGQWATPSHMPCSQPLLADLVFLFNNNEPQGQFAEIASALDANADVRRCFRDVHFAYANLTGASDKYPKGPDNQFYMFLFREVFWSETWSNAALRADWQYFFLMEPDCRVIRPNWLDRVLDEISHTPSFWVKGSTYRPSPLHPRGWESLPMPRRLHINGNAIYNYRDGAFINYVRFAKSVQPDGCPYDCALEEVLFGRPDIGRHVQHKFIRSDFIQNLYHNPWVADWYREHYPGTFIMHGGSEQKDGR